jgi:hypothetical protein
MNVAAVATQATRVRSTAVPKQTGESTTQAPADSVKLGQEEHPSFLHLGARAVAGTFGAIVSTPFAVTRGAIQHAGDEIHSPFIEPKPGEMKILKTVGAISGALLGGLIGVAAGGPSGLVLGMTTGPILGAVLAGGTPGAVEAGLSSSKGAIFGVGQGVAGGYQVGAHLVDRFWAASGN